MEITSTIGLKRIYYLSKVRPYGTVDINIPFGFNTQVISFIDFLN